MTYPTNISIDLLDGSQKIEVPFLTFSDGTETCNLPEKVIQARRGLEVTVVPIGFESEQHGS